ncbi:hypothetical protein MJN85_32930, partial [Salmonella enterica subsp. enterica serovar Anatum]|nr:hypothetical protein [Salmonella enterica subsp. enterica serovar Anatum]
ASDRYQQQIADAIYRGLRKYFAAHPIQSAPQGGPGQTASTNQGTFALLSGENTFLDNSSCISFSPARISGGNKKMSTIFTV